MMGPKQVLSYTATMRRVHFVYLALLWIAGPLKVQAQCEKPKFPNMILTAEDIQKTDFPDGTQVTFQCSVGYVTAGGSGVTTCNAAVWSDVTLDCKKFKCKALDIANGDVHYSGDNSFGDHVSFSCKDGFLLVGSSRLTCGASDWLGRVPSCEVVQCERPDAVANADGPTPNSELHSFASVVRYSCLKDFTMNGSSTLTCSKNGSFIPSPPTCLKVLCPEPIVTNGARKSGARPPYLYKSFLVYQCDANFEMEGSATMTCQLNSTWTSIPICRAEGGTVKPTVKPTVPSDGTKADKTWWIVILVICIVGSFIVIIIVVIRKKKRRFDPRREPVPVEDGEKL